MKLHHERLFNESGDCAALRAAHVPEAPPFNAYTFHGSDLDHPMKLDLYASDKPAHNEYPIAVYDRVDEDLVLRPKEEPIKRVRAAAGAVPLSEAPIAAVQKTMVYKETP